MQNASTIVLIHGWNSNTASWDVIKQKLENKGYSVYVVKLPGFDMNEPTQSWGIQLYARYVITKLKEQEIESPYILVGHSFGGRIATFIAATYPKMVETLILTDAAGVSNRKTFKLLTIKAIYWVLNQMDKSPRLIATSSHIKRFMQKKVASSDYRNATPRMREILKNVVALDLTEYLPHIAAKTLILWGENDLVTPFRDALVFHRGIQGSTLATLKNAGHNAHLQFPQAWVDFVDRFIRGKLNQKARY